MKREFSFIVVSAGRGSRLGGIPKQIRILGDKPLWLWSVNVAEELWKNGYVKECIIVAPSEAISDFTEKTEKYVSLPVRIVPGGNTRFESVMDGLNAASSSFVMVHDAARPFLNQALCESLIKKTSHESGAIPVLDVVDALKKVTPEGYINTIDRIGFKLTQTPQCFPRVRLLEAMHLYGCGARDEAEAWIQMGFPLEFVNGDRQNFKITYEEDWNMAKRLASTCEYRTGLGYDIHPLVPGRSLVLGGVHIPDFSLGLAGHSDADLVCHAVADAILGGAGLPDIGILFPANDDRYKNADSGKLLEETHSLVRQEGWNIQWIDVVIRAQRPILGEMIFRIARNLNTILFRVPNARKVNVKVKSGEHIGPEGECECMSCQTIATLARPLK